MDLSQPQIDFTPLIQRLGEDASKRLYQPDSPEYPKLLVRWSKLSVRPAAAVFVPQSPQEISIAITFATEYHVDIAVHGGGHSICASSSSNGGLVINLKNMNSVNVDQEKKTVTCGGGCIWRDVHKVTGEHDLAVISASVDDVGVGGYLLGGGFGYLAGEHGLGIDNLLSVEMVLASGEIVTVSDEQNSELFWAIRGAGAQFGVATSFTFKAHEQKNNIYFGPLIFPPTSSAISGILDFSNSYFGSERDDGKAAIMFMLTHKPPDYKNPLIIASVFYNGSKEEGTKLFKPLLDLNPISNMAKEMTYAKAMTIKTNLAVFDLRWNFTGFNFKFPIEESVFTGIIENYQELIKKYPDDHSIGKGLLAFEIISNKKIRELHNGSFAGRGDRYFGAICSLWEGENKDKEMRDWIWNLATDITKKTKVYDKEEKNGTYIFYEEPKVSASEKFGDNYKRLKELKAKYDPGNLFNKGYSLA